MLSSGSGPAGGAMEGAAEGLLAARRAAASSSSLCSSAADGRVRGGHCVPQEGGQRGSRLKPFNRTRTLSCCAPTMRPLCAPTMCPLAVHPPRAHLMCTHYIPTSAVHPLHAHLCRAPTMCPSLPCTHYVPISAMHPLSVGPLHAHLCRAPTTCPSLPCTHYVPTHCARIMCLSLLCTHYVPTHCMPICCAPTMRPLAVAPLCAHLCRAQYTAPWREWPRALEAALSTGSSADWGSEERTTLGPHRQLAARCGPEPDFPALNSDLAPLGDADPVTSRKPWLGWRAVAESLFYEAGRKGCLPKSGLSAEGSFIQNRSRFLQKCFQLEKERELQISGEGRLQSPDTLDE